MFAAPSGFQGAPRQRIFIEILERLPNGCIGQGFGDTSLQQFSSQPCRPDRLAGKARSYPPFCIGAVVEIAEIDQAAHCAPDLDGRRALASEKLLDLRSRPIQPGQIPHRRLKPIDGSMRGIFCCSPSHQISNSASTLLRTASL